MSSEVETRSAMVNPGATSLDFALDERAWVRVAACGAAIAVYRLNGAAPLDVPASPR